MANFNTNQARHMYVAGANKTSVAAVTSNLDLYVGSMTDPSSYAEHTFKHIYFVYKNADGIITRSDTIPVGNIEYITKKAYADMAKKLQMHTITINADLTLNDLVGTTLFANVRVGEIASYDSSDAVTITAGVPFTSAMASTPANFYKALAVAIAKALPKKDYPYFRVFYGTTEVTAATKVADLTGTTANVILVQSPQKYVRGKLTGEAMPFSVSFATSKPDTFVEGWGVDTVAASTVTGYTVIPALHELADLEYFCLGERGDVYRGNNWPNNYEPTYAINPAGSTTYDLLTIQYFWQGHAENIQKSPRTIHIAAPAAVLTAIESAINAVISPTEENQGSDAEH